MTALRLLPTAFFLLGAVSSLATPAYADFLDMLRRVPAEANVLMLIDAEQVAASPLATREGWREKREADYEARPLTFPPHATKLVRAAQFDMDTHESKWQIAILEAARIPTLDQIAKKAQGYLDTVANTSAVWSPRGWYGFKLNDHALGVMFPPNRQYLARWIKSPPGRMSPYLQRAADRKNAKSQVVLAIDLEDVVKPQQVEERLKQMEALKGNKNIGEIAKTLTSLQGVRFEVAIGDKAFGNLTLDFASNPSAIGGVAKSLVLEALGDAGLYVDDLEGWALSVDAKSVTLHGGLSHSALMRLSSLLELPSPPLDESGRDADKVDAGDPKLYATQNYFKSTQTLLNDLLARKSESRGVAHSAQFIEMYARRIDRLPLVNVDPEMQEYGQFVVHALGEAYGAFKGAGIKSGVRSQQVSAYNYDYYGNQVASGAQQRAAGAEDRAAGALTGVSLRQQIADETSKIRRLMTKRYNVNF